MFAPVLIQPLLDSPPPIRFNLGACGVCQLRPPVPALSLRIAHAQTV